MGEVLALVQAGVRGLNHTGLPDKSMEQVGGKPLLGHFLEKIKSAKKIDSILVVSSPEWESRGTIEVAKSHDVSYLTVEEDKFYIPSLDKYYWSNFPNNYLTNSNLIRVPFLQGLLRSFSCDHVVVTDAGESIFLDPSFLDKSVDEHLDRESDNTLIKQERCNSFYADILSLSALDKYQAEFVEEFRTRYHNRLSLDTLTQPSPGLLGAARRSLQIMSNRDLILLGEIHKHLGSNGHTPSHREWESFMNTNPAHLVPFPHYVNVEPTSDCNMSCVFCPQPHLARPSGYMKLDLYKSLIDDVAPYGDDVIIDIGLYGEPLLHPEVAAMVKIAKDKGCRSVILNTNGLLLNRKTNQDICEAGLDFIMIGLDSASEKTHRATRGNEDYASVVANIDRLLEVRAGLSSPSPKVVLQIVKAKANDEEIEGFFDLWDKKVDHIVLKGFNRFNGRVEDNSVIDCTPLERYPCRKMLDKISVLWNGDVPYCEQDFDAEILLGNIARQPLSAIWEKTQDIRLQHLIGNDGLPDMCRKCSEWYYV